MALTILRVNFKDIGDQGLRLDMGYRDFFDVQNQRFEDFGGGIELKRVLKTISTKTVSKGILEQKESLIELGNIERRQNGLLNVQKVGEIGSSKKVLQRGDLVISKLEPRVGNCFLNLRHERYLGSTELLEYSISESMNPLFLYYMLTSKRFLSGLGKLESGKTHRRVSASDFLKIRIPKISKLKQDELGAEIKGIEERMKKLKKQIKSSKEVIDPIFGRRFGFSFEKFGGLLGGFEKEKFFEIHFEKICNHRWARMSIHSQRVGFSCLKEELKTRGDWVSIQKKFKLLGGKRIPKNEILPRERTNFYYLRGEDLKEGGIQKEGLLWISRKTYEKLKEYRIRTGELCISIVGTLGKVALVDTNGLGVGGEEDLMDNLILSENLMKLVPKERLSGEFYDYFFRSWLFKAQIEGEYTLKAIKKLGIDKCGELRVPNISMGLQEEVVDEVKKGLNEQEKLREELGGLRAEIEGKIEGYIK